MKYSAVIYGPMDHHYRPGIVLERKFSQNVSMEVTASLKYTSGIYTVEELEFFFKHSQNIEIPDLVKLLKKVKREYALVRLLFLQPM